MAKTKKKTRRVAKSSLASSRSNVTATSSSSFSTPMTETHMTFSQLLAGFILFTVANVVLLFLANMLFPAHVVLGNHVVSAMSGLLLSSATLGLIAIGATPLIESGSELVKTRLSNGQWMGIYLVINIVAVWLVGRLAEEVGLGISSWLVAVVLGIVMNVIQGVLIMSVVSRLVDRSA